MKKSFAFLTPLFLLFSLLTMSCNKSESDLIPLNIRLTDGPGDFQEVNIDLQEVKVNFSKDTTDWISLSTKTGIYDLLKLQDGMDTLIAEANLPSGTIQEVRLILGTNNSVKVNDVTFPLSIPSGEESGFKIKVNKPLETFQTLVVDFDAGLSVNQVESSYKLRPVLKIQ
jgi:hypothetical protein